VTSARTLGERLSLLARHLEAFEAPGLSFGTWEPSWTDRAGIIHLGWYRPSPAAEAFLAGVAEGGWVQPFDWMAWLETERGKELAGSPKAVASANADELGKLLTAVVRSDRFSDGSLAGAYESGLLTAVLRRAKALAALG
jgi:hypothetical protein